jgi:hypothetical protein
VLYKTYNRISQGRDFLEALGWIWKLLLLAPILGPFIGYTIDGMRGALIVGLILLALLIVVLVVAIVIAVQRLPINIDIIPHPTSINGLTSTARVTLQRHGKSQIAHVAFWSKLSVNNYGHEDHRITGLLAEFRKPVLGVYPKTLAIARCRYQEPDNRSDVDWFLPKAGAPVQRLADFVSMDYLSDEKLSPGDDGLSVRIVAEIGSRQRRVYVQYDGDVDVLGPYV